MEYLLGQVIGQGDQVVAEKLAPLHSGDNHAWPVPQTGICITERQDATRIRTCGPRGALDLDWDEHAVALEEQVHLSPAMGPPVPGPGRHREMLRLLERVQNNVSFEQRPLQGVSAQCGGRGNPLEPRRQPRIRQVSLRPHRHTLHRAGVPRRHLDPLVGGGESR